MSSLLSGLVFCLTPSSDVRKSELVPNVGTPTEIKSVRKSVFQLKRNGRFGSFFLTLGVKAKFCPLQDRYFMSVLSKAHKTSSLTKENAVKGWFIVDAEGKTLGRLASGIAARLRGKHKPTFTPNQDCGDNIIVINASKVKVTGNKETQKMYYHHSRYPGGMTETVFKDLIAKQPEKIIYEAVKGMLPKSKLGDKMLTHCKIFSGAEHNLQAQKPVKLEI